MADPNDRWEDNAPGTWYVDKSCILCGLCVELAPENFRESEDGDHDILYKQPNEEELAQCEEAKEQCPTESVGNDG